MKVKPTNLLEVQLVDALGGVDLALVEAQVAASDLRLDI